MSRPQQVGDPDTLYEHPANAFVAGFIGSPPMCLNPVQASGHNGDVRLSSGPVDLIVPMSGQAPPTEVIMGIRPEHIRVWSDHEHLIGPSQGLVEYVGVLGRETIVGVVAGEDLRFVVQLEGRMRTALGLDSQLRAQA